MVMIVNILSTSGGIFQEYPYFSQDIRTLYEKEPFAKQNVNRNKPLRNMLLTFDPASMRALKEFIWIDHQ